MSLFAKMFWNKKKLENFEESWDKAIEKYLTKLKGGIK